MSKPITGGHIYVFTIAAFVIWFFIKRAIEDRKERKNSRHSCEKENK